MSNSLRQPGYVPRYSARFCDRSGPPGADQGSILTPTSRKREHTLYLCRDPESLERALAEQGIIIDDVLREHGIDLGSSGVLLTGSLSEGFGSASSDVDLMVLMEDDAGTGSLTGRAEGSVGFRAKISREYLHYQAGVEINIEIVSRPSMRHALSSFIQIAPALYDPSQLTAVPLLPARERRILHRLRTGWALRGADTVAIWRDELFTELFPTYVVLARYIGHLELLEDVAAHAGESDDTFALTARDSAAEALWCLLALHGVTGQKNKWLAKYMGTLDDAAEAERASRILDIVFAPRRMTPDAQYSMLAELQEISAQLLDHIRRDPGMRRAADYLRSSIQYVPG